VPDDLYTRYMKAYQANEQHKRSCTRCNPDAPCPAGAPLAERFARLQDAYLTRQREQRRRS
jgi:predicted aldo/keto reductase-like oxidoreductase